MIGNSPTRLAVPLANPFFSSLLIYLPQNLLCDRDRWEARSRSGEKKGTQGKEKEWTEPIRAITVHEAL